MKVITIGGATQDIVVTYENAEMYHRATATGTQSFILLEEGKKIDIDSVEYYTGGGATNSAVSFARLGFSTSTFFKAGLDHQAQLILEKLILEKVIVDHVVQKPNITTSVSFIIAGPSGDKVVLVYRGASKTLTDQELPLEALKNHSMAYITSLSGQGIDLLPVLVSTAKKSNLLVAVNPGSSQLKDGAHALRTTLNHIDILLLNRFEASLLMHSLSSDNPITLENTIISHKGPLLLHTPIVYQNISFMLSQFCKKIIGMGTKIIVITNGSEGVYVATAGKLFFHPSLPTKVVSTLGAGDAFGSGFSAAILSGKSIADAIRCGILNSTSVIQHPDAKTGLLSKTELDEQFKNLNPELLQEFTL